MSIRWPRNRWRIVTRCQCSQLNPQVAVCFHTERERIPIYADYSKLMAITMSPTIASLDSVEVSLDNVPFLFTFPFSVYFRTFRMRLGRLAEESHGFASCRINANRTHVITSDNSPLMRCGTVQHFRLESFEHSKLCCCFGS